MVRKRPCRICGRWFRPDVRVGPRQRTCGAVPCQRAWHRRTCRAWRWRNPDYDRDDRLRRRLKPRASSPCADPLAELDWSVVREAIGLQVAVVVEETGGVLIRWAREEFAAQRSGIAREIDRLLPPAARDAMGGARPAP
jgi:hypothetical protein